MGCEGSAKESPNILMAMELGTSNMNTVVQASEVMRCEFRVHACDAQEPFQRTNAALLLGVIATASLVMLPTYETICGSCYPPWRFSLCTELSVHVKEPKMVKLNRKPPTTISLIAHVFALGYHIPQLHFLFFLVHPTWHWLQQLSFFNSTLVQHFSSLNKIMQLSVIDAAFDAAQAPSPSTTCVARMCLSYMEYVKPGLTHGASGRYWWKV